MNSNRLKLTIALFIITLTVQAQTPPIVYVAGDGTGDYNCDGVSDQIEINQALDFVYANANYTTVFLKGANTFWINEPIYISENTILEGDSNAVIKLIDNAGWWTQYKPLIGQKGTEFTFGLADTSISTGNITIRGFEIDGNRNYQAEPSGNSYYIIILLQSCYNITINDMYLHDNLADAIQTGFLKPHVNINSKFYNNRIHKNGHSGIFLGNVDNFQIYNNIITNNRTNSGVRAQYCNHFKIYNNIIGNDPNRRFSGDAAIQIDVRYNTPINDVEIYGNYLYGMQNWHGIWLHSEDDIGTLNTHRDVYIHHNVISWYKLAGIGIYGFNNTIIENNVIEINGESGISFYKGNSTNTVTRYRTIVKNNIIVNNTAFGIDNQQPEIHSFTSDYNCIYRNKSGHYNNTSSLTDIYTEPIFAYENKYNYDTYGNNTYDILSPAWQEALNNNDYRGDLGANKAWVIYHPRSEAGRWNGFQWIKDSVSSPCIDAGDPMAYFLNEPNPNGDRINIGAFGNTTEASKSKAILSVKDYPSTNNFIYPNPTSDKIIFPDNLINNNFVIFSITGKVVKRGVINSNEISLSEFSSGVYFIRITEKISGELKVFKLIKK